MKKKILTILIPSLIIVFGLTQTNILANVKRGLSSTAQAGGDLTIDWGVPAGQPIFYVLNFLPGDKEEKEITIVNNTAITQPVGVRGIKTAEIGELPPVLDFTISTNGTDLYGGTAGAKTLAQFFNDSASPDGVFLFNLSQAESKTVKFSVKFSESAGNEFQKTSVVFDIVIGVSSPVPSECRNIRFNKIIYGTEKNNYLRGTNGNDLILGFEGNDWIDGTNGNDCIIGGLGNDLITGGNNNDIIFGNEGNDTLSGSNGDDFIAGGDGDDKIYGENGNDQLKGENGNDQLRGGNNNDLIWGNEGTDFANGELGRDQCEAERKTSCEL